MIIFGEGQLAASCRSQRLSGIVRPKSVDVVFALPRFQQGSGESAFLDAFDEAAKIVAVGIEDGCIALGTGSFIAVGGPDFDSGKGEMSGFCFHPILSDDRLIPPGSSTDRYPVERHGDHSNVIDWWHNDEITKCDDPADAELIAFALNRLSHIDRAEFILRYGGSN